MVGIYRHYRMASLYCDFKLLISKINPIVFYNFCIHFFMENIDEASNNALDEYVQEWIEYNAGKLRGNF